MRILIAAGGTGGHLFPAVAIAEALRTKDPQDDILFAITGKPLEKKILANKKFDWVSVVGGGLKGVSLLGKGKSFARTLMGTWQALDIVRRFRPDVVVGVGGYASGPVSLIARLTGKKLVIHEQNVLPGLTNRILGRFAHRVCVSFPPSRVVFKSSKTVLTGNPVRPDFLESGPGQGRKKGFTIFVTGGSQGAHSINCAAVEALDYLREPAEKVFMHQTGIKDLPWVKRAYEERGIQAVVEPFFEEMAQAYRAADLVICRAGATTVAELAAVGKAAILVPYPSAAAGHQELNARYIASGGGGEMVLQKDLSGNVLAERINHYASNLKALEAMAVRASALSYPKAAEVIADECKELLVSSPLCSRGDESSPKCGKT
jgi:UDP-N-acetylglucosamine--N-acetylmuramyl-(pentapeptide) pyrophosphoryl-undecaprenol N-acetylglucosamine transferase